MITRIFGFLVATLIFRPMIGFSLSQKGVEMTMLFRSLKLLKWRKTTESAFSSSRWKSFTELVLLILTNCARHRIDHAGDLGGDRAPPNTFVFAVADSADEFGVGISEESHGVWEYADGLLSNGASRASCV